jgi:hypothetical protein
MKTKRRTTKVWRIFRFRERFELPDDVRFCRDKPLEYIRDYIGSGTKEESIHYKRQISACEASKNVDRLLRVFYKLREIAGNHTRAYRGYLLDENFEPAENNKIAIWIGLTKQETEKILKELEQIGLIEMVIPPKFDLSLNEKPPKRERRRGNKSRNNPSAHGKSRSSSSAHGKSRSSSSAHEKHRDSLKYKSESGNGILKRNKKTGKIPEKDKRQANSKEQPANAAIGERQEQSADNPNTNPTESDGEVGNDKLGTRTYPPRQSFTHSYLTTQYKDPQQIGAVFAKLYNPEAEEFAREVYKTIGTSALDSKEEHSELACWKQAWAEALIAGIAPYYLTALWDRVMQEARKLRIKRWRKPKSYWTKSPEAVLRKLFDRFLNNAKRQAEMDEPRRAIATGG